MINKNCTNILIIEDEIYLSEILECALQEEGYIIIKANNATDAEKYISKSKFDIILADIVLPGASGTDIYNDVKNKYPETVFIFMSGSEIDEDFQSATGNLPYHFISKPFNLSDVTGLIEKIIAKTE